MFPGVGESFLEMEIQLSGCGTILALSRLTIKRIKLGYPREIISVKFAKKIRKYAKVSLVKRNISSVKKNIP